jgi:membrane-associated protease RseP (regulator of RpoE activity)
METLMIALQLWTALILSIMIHELGHTLAAAITGMRVQHVQIGFGKMLKLPMGEGTIQLGWWPVAGYVTVAGMRRIGPAKDDRDFRNKPLVSRLVVILAGCGAQVAAVFGIWTDAALKAGAGSLGAAMYQALHTAADMVLLVTTIWTMKAPIEPLLSGSWSTAAVLNATACMALLQAALNLVPAPNLDGGRAWRELFLPKGYGTNVRIVAEPTMRRVHSRGTPKARKTPKP